MWKLTIPITLSQTLNWENMMEKSTSSNCKMFHNFLNELEEICDPKK